MYGSGAGAVTGGVGAGGLAATGTNVGLLIILALVLLVSGVALMRLAVVRR